MNTATIELSNSAEKYENRRRHPRHAVRIEALLHAHGKVQPTIINDLSAGGAGLNGAIGIFADDAIEIELAGGRRIRAKVAWWISGCCGVQFDKALDPADPLFANAG